jgi:hypothetical protein
VTTMPTVMAKMAYDDARYEEIGVFLVHQSLHFDEFNHCSLYLI